jgi:DNA-binding response OmpR family regulator
MEKFKILLVEDDPEVSNILEENLKKESRFSISTAKTYKEASREISLTVYDVIILDLLLPDGYGLDLISLINHELTKVIVLSKENTAETRMNSYKNGIDAFIGKPFYPKELTLLVKRSLNLLNNNILNIDNKIFLDIDKQAIKTRTTTVKLTKTELLILKSLFKHINQSVSKELLVKTISQTSDRFYTAKRLTVAITRLRKKLDNLNIPLKITPHYGKGYILSIKETS